MFAGDPGVAKEKDEAAEAEMHMAELSEVWYERLTPDEKIDRVNRDIPIY